MRYRTGAILFALPLLCGGCRQASAPPGGLAAAGAPPATRREPVVDRYHGVEVVDDYRWLEDGDDPEVQAWSAAQNAYARSLLDRLPGVASIRQEVTAIRQIEVPRYGEVVDAGGRLFAMKRQPPKQQPLLVAMASVDDPGSERVVVDPGAIDPNGGTSIDWYVPSPDGSRVAVSLSQGGSERGDVHLFDSATGEEVAEVVHHVSSGTALGSLAWDADGGGFLYTRYPREGERPSADLDFYVQVYHHRLGTAESSDGYELGEGFPRIAEIILQPSPDGRFALAEVQRGDSGEFAHFLRAPDGRWLPLTGFDDPIVHVFFGPAGSLGLLSRGAAPRGELLQLPLAEVVRAGRIDPAEATPLVPESDGVIEFDYYGLNTRRTIVWTAARLFVIEGVGGPQRVRIFDPAGKPLGALPLPPSVSVEQLVATGEEELVYGVTSYTEPTAWYRWTPEGGAVKTALSVPFPIDLTDVQVVRDEAVSQDGTHVPMTILHGAGTKLDGTNPTLLTGYGGFDISLTPSFDPGLRLWIDHGGVKAIANLRGGGELGEAWHRAGNLTRKQSVFDDFIACAERLVSAGYTTADRLAIEGGSNGGLLMGAALTQRPDLFKAVVSHVGIYDMLRVELDPNGVFNIPEFGTVEDEEQFHALYAYSPYHRVRDGVAYPPVLFLTGANDPRVNPMQSRKMTARLQAAGAQVLLRTSATSGHGSGTRLGERIEQEVDVLAFLFDRLGMTQR